MIAMTNREGQGRRRLCEKIADCDTTPYYYGVARTYGVFAWGNGWWEFGTREKEQKKRRLDLVRVSGSDMPRRQLLA